MDRMLSECRGGGLEENPRDSWSHARGFRSLVLGSRLVLDEVFGYARVGWLVNESGIICFSLGFSYALASFSYPFVLSRLPAACSGDMVMATVKKGAPGLRKKGEKLLITSPITFPPHTPFPYSSLSLCFRIFSLMSIEPRIIVSHPSFSL